MSYCSCSIIEHKGQNPKLNTLLGLGLCVKHRARLRLDVK